MVRSIARTPARRPRPLTDAEWKHAVETLGLSPRQSDIAGLMLRGLRDKQIANDLGIAQPTLRTHLRQMFARHDVSDRLELVLLVINTGRGHHQE